MARKQQLISRANKIRTDNYYIKNKREEGQQKIFTCSCCGKEFDFGDSEDYVGAVEQWEQLGGKCYACGKGFCCCPKGGENGS